MINLHNQISRAESAADMLREFSRRVDDASWQLDAALSAIDKDSHGYRQGNAANRTGGANAAPGELETALASAESILSLAPLFAALDV